MASMKNYKIILLQTREVGYNVFLNSLPNDGESGNNTSNEGASIPQMTQEISWADDSVPDSNSVSEGVEELGMPEIVNLYESGLRRSPRLAENKSRRSVLTTLFCFG